jgi:hypothetical protein
MQHNERAAAIAAIAANPHHYCGIRPTPSGPEPSSEVASIDVTANAAAQFDYVFPLAESYWPNARSWQVVGSDNPEQHPIQTQPSMLPEEFEDPKPLKIVRAGIDDMRSAEVIGEFTSD